MYLHVCMQTSIYVDYIAPEECEESLVGGRQTDYPFSEVYHGTSAWRQNRHIVYRQKLDSFTTQ